MIDLVQYREYWERMAHRVAGITDVIPVTVDDAMAKSIQRLPIGSMTLFFLPPAAESSGRNIDSFREDNECVVFVMEKYDPQRKSAWSALESSQPIIEAVKQQLLEMRPCAPVTFDVSTITTLPETKFFAGFAGWSIGFKLKT